MKHRFGTLLRPVSLVAAIIVTSPATAGNIYVRISGFANESGMARVILMKDHAGYHGVVPVERVGSVRIRDGVAYWTAPDVRPGRYAIIAHHDINSDNDLDRPFLTLPLEPYGYSNGVWTNAGLPEWEEVAFDVGAGSEAVRQNIHIRMNMFAVLGQMAMIAIPSMVLIFAGLALVRHRRRAVVI